MGKKERKKSKRQEQPGRAGKLATQGQPEQVAGGDGVGQADHSSAKGTQSASQKTSHALLSRPVLIRIAACLFAGTMLFLAFPRTDLWPLAWVALIPLMWAVEGQSPKAAFSYGLLAGLTINMGGFYWIHGLLVTFGHLPHAVAFPLYVLLCAYQGLLVAVWVLLITKFRRTTPAGRMLLGVSTFVALEFTIPFVFPWYMGNSQYLFLPAIQIADLVGVLGVSAVVILVNCCLYEALRAAIRREPLPAIPMAVTAIILSGSLLYGVLRIEAIDAQIKEAPHMRIGMVEGNVGIREKEHPDHVAANLLIHQKLSRMLEKDGAELIVWPESAYDSRYISRNAEHIPQSRADLRPDPRWDELTFDEDGILRVPDPLPLPLDLEADEADNVPLVARTVPQRGFKTPLFFGAVTFETDPNPRAPGPRWRHRVYNSALLIDGEGHFADRLYDKNYRLIFGEYLPFGRTFPKLYDLIPAAAAFEGSDEIRIFSFKEARIAPLICYEGILPRFVMRFSDEQLNPNLFINITNDAWFGKTSEPYLHLALTVLRATEHRRALVRSTNTGVSAFIDPVGRILSATDIYGAEALIRDVPLMETETIYQSLGDLLAWLCLIGSLIVIGTPTIQSLKKKKTKATSKA